MSNLKTKVLDFFNSMSITNECLLADAFGVVFCLGLDTECFIFIIKLGKIQLGVYIQY
jgi:hypothetical protein